MTQFLAYRIGKIDGIVRQDAVQISQTVKGALERFLYQSLERFRGHFSQPDSMLSKPVHHLQRRGTK